MKGQPTEIWKIYNKANSTLEIPVYQRNYDWGTTQCARLFDDLEHLAEADPERHPKHFFGAVVGKSEDSWTWIVIDGQQRLTTISLLILAIHHAVRDGDIDVGNDPALAKKLVNDFLLVDADPRNLKFKLKPVKNDAAAYKALFGADADFIDASNVTANYRYFRDRLRKTGLDAHQVWNAVSRLEVMHLDLEPHDDPQRIFESLNSTGLNLSEADKIRNLVLMNHKLREQERLYEERWNPIEENVEYRTDWFIRWYLTAKTNTTPREADVFEAFKRYLQRSDRTVSEVLDDMYEYSKYSRAITHSDTGFPLADRRLRRANLIIGDVVRPFLMPVVGDAQRGIITERDLDEVIHIIETYIFRRTTCSVPANALNKIFATAYSELRKLRTADQSYASLLTYIIRRRDGGSGRFPTDADFRDSFESRDFYHVRPTQRQYLFDILENGDSKDNRDIAEKISSGDLTIEHIMPQTLPHAWLEELGPDAGDIHDAWENRIGNLTVTGYNSAYSNSSFARKKAMESGFSTSPYRLNEDVKSADRWDEDAMRSRSRRMASLALDYWRNIDTDFRPPEVVRPTEPMGTDTVFTGRWVTGYEFGEASETVTDWGDLVQKVLFVLLQQDRAGLLAFAEDDQLLTTAPRPDGDKSLRIIDPGLGVWVNNNTWNKISFLRRVFAHLSLDPEDLVFTLRPAKSPSPEESPNDSGLATRPSTYSEITKFRDAVTEAEGLRPEADATVDLRAEFTKDFASFHRDGWLSDLGGQPLSSFISGTPVETMTAVQAIAVISGFIASEQVFGPGAVHGAIIDGTMGRLLARLDEVG
ncbi:DUF262 domain-containing protein [Corynebacterium glyciniphilum]|uniref:DUF262 domain-containing protein n=1 Tax=Corynebacterium glyciniphilum TaxID=1404244 RepID=UPI002656E5FF|nr:DUF262 domain-containing protein [Corynebacterium glyciniphilum]MDN5682641.1 DUF262 domain-containing protein [Corynebacterium glyciniphilum]MDN6706334.1 DUF262 domain-containing protein [Corynebacterium glyciniphilum]